MVGGAAQGQFPQGQQVAFAEETLHRVLGLLRDVDLAFLQALQQLLGRDVHQLDLVGPLEQGVRDVLPHQHPGDLGHSVLEAFQVLHVHRGEHVDARVQQVDHVLPALHVKRALDVGVGQFVHEDERGLALQGCLQVELLQLGAPVGEDLPGQHRDPLGQGDGVPAAVGLHHPGHHVHPLVLADAGFLEHGVGLADARGHAEEYLQPGALGAGLLLLHFLQQGIRVGSFGFHPLRLT